MLIAAASASIALGPSHCHVCRTNGSGCSTSYGVTSSWSKLHEVQRVSDHSGISFRCENPFIGTTEFHCLRLGHATCLSRVSVAADYPDSLPESSNCIGNNGYHPLEELRNYRRIRDPKLTAAEIARTTVEANDNALLVFPGMVHCEPHEEISWAEFQYVIDDYGDIFFEIFDGENILQDCGASNIVNALFAMDIPNYENRRLNISDYTISEGSFNDELPFSDDYFEVEDAKTSDVHIDWGMPDSSNWIHPIYFTKSLTKALNAEHEKMMDRPSNGVSIWGQLKPAFLDEELYVRLSNDDDNNGYTSDWIDGGNLGFSSRDYGSSNRSTIYRLEIMDIQLFSRYGTQLAISLQDFQDAEPDILVHSESAIIEWFHSTGMRFNFDLKALCKKKGLHVEQANLIGVDSLGIDVRVSLGTEVWTHRFPFKIRATSEAAAEKQILQLLFPRSPRKRLMTRERSRDID